MTAGAMTSAQAVPLLEAFGISKRYGGAQALDRVALTLFPAEVVALIGENGAGKSTFMKTLGGIVQPDEGTLKVDGKLVRLENPAAAMALGISLIHQELNLAENLSVDANLFLGREKTFGGWLGFLSRSAMRQHAVRLLDRVGLDVSPDERLGNLTPGQKQMVEIARSLSLDARILIMDEPTSSLTQKETDRLLELIRELKAQGVCVVYISHRLREVEAIADRVVGLRDGKNAGGLARNEIDYNAMVRMMVGRNIKLFNRPESSLSQKAAHANEPILKVVEFCHAHSQGNGVTLEIRPGEIVGMAGLIGSGRTEFAEAVFGLRQKTKGTLWVHGKEQTVKSPQDAMKLGIALVPEDRRKHGLILADSIKGNISLPNLDSLHLLKLLNFRAIASAAHHGVKSLRVRTTGIAKLTGQLSGGNQQKVVLSKWLHRKPKLLILDEPTRGVDVGAKKEIYDLMQQLTDQGVGILMISSDMEEVMHISDRVVVMHEGKRTGELNRQEMNEESIMRLATGTVS